MWRRVACLADARLMRPGKGTIRHLSDEDRRNGSDKFDAGLLGFEGVEVGRKLRNASGSGIPMEGSFGHGFVKG